jgi:hypothetical protein
MTYTFLDFATMFFSNFAVVFLLGLQSKNVNQGRYMAAAMTSVGISVSQWIFVKYATHGDWRVFVTCAFGGALGIASSIWFYKNFMEARRT